MSKPGNVMEGVRALEVMKGVKCETQVHVKRGWGDGSREREVEGGKRRENKEAGVRSKG